MAPLLPLLLLASPAELRMQERAPLAVLLVVPSGEAGQASRSELLRSLDALIRRHTDLRITPVDSTSAERCQGALTCLLPLAWGTSPYLLILSNIAGTSKGDVISAMLIDTKAALEIYDAAPRRTPEWLEDVEAEVQKAVVVRAAPSSVRSGEETTHLLEALFSERLRPVLEPAGHWEPYGAIELVASPGSGVFVDGTGVGETVGPITTILDVPPGDRVLRLEHPDYFPFEVTAAVTRGEATRVEVEPTRRPSPISEAFRTTLLWTGAGAFAGGAVVTIYAAVKKDAPDRCLRLPDAGDACATSSGFDRAGDLLLAPFGYSLAGLGATWALAVLLTDASYGIPWIETLVGALIGATAYGLSAALD